MGHDARFGQQRRVMLPGGPPAPVAPPCDRIMQPIKKGQLVVFKADNDPIFEVLDVKPVMDPRQPPGLVQVTLAATLVIGMRAGAPASSVLVIGAKEAVHVRMGLKTPLQPDDAPSSATQDDPPSNSGDPGEADDQPELPPIDAPQPPAPAPARPSLVLTDLD